MAIVQQIPSMSMPPGETTGNYAELKRLIKAQGLLDKPGIGYLVRVVVIQALFLASLATLALVHHFLVACLVAIVMAFLSTQIGFIGHDAGHRQVFDSTTRNDILGLFQGNLLLGMSFSWWNDKHNAHHSKPNEIDSDPDVNVPMIAFTQEDVFKRQGFAKFMTKHQVWFFFPMLALVGLDLKINSIKFLLAGRAKHTWLEAGMLALHYVWYFGLIFLALPVWQAVAFVVIHQLVTGLYLGSVFAPNHKGMLVTQPGSQIDFLQRQVLTARNVYANPLTDFWYGGLNYQIEHHLFPSMPRGHLGRAQRIVRAYCEEHQISYHETTFTGSYGEILTYLHTISAPLRAERAA